MARPTPSSRPALGRLFRGYIRPYARDILIAIACMAAAGSATAANALLMKPVIDEIFLNRNSGLLIWLPLLILFAAIVKGAATYGQALIVKRVGQQAVARMQMDLYRHLLQSDIAMFSASSSGRLISRLTNDIHVIRRNLTNVLVGFAKELVTLILLVGVMFYQSIILSLVGLIAFPLAVLPILRLGRRMRRVSHSTQQELETYTGRLDDTFQGIRIVKAYGNEQYEAERAQSMINSILNLYIRAARIESAASPVTEALAGVAIAAVVFYGGQQVLSGATTPGAFFSFIAALIMAYRPMKTLSSLNANMQEGLAAVTRVFQALDTAPLVKEKPDAEPLSSGGDIVLRDVSFHYQPGKPALSGLSLNVPAGKRVALVGPSGGGKTTIFNLILRFYDPAGGSVLIGGHDLRGVTMASLRARIALVNQEATLFDDTIAANIAYGKHGATRDEIIAAAKAASAHDFIMQQPQGYDTPAGQGGMRLSGGQRQRIAIARAMLKNAPILLLDEATSALDAESEKHVQQALNALMENRTTIVIAHRLSTVLNADLIYVINDGQVAEQGTHAELLARNGLYHRLYHTQFIKEAKAGS